MPASPHRSKRRDLRRNYLLFFIESVGYPLGFSLISSSTIIPLLLTTLGASNLVVGMAPALGNLGLFLPGVFSAPYMERTPIKKRIMVGFALIERAFILLIAAMVLIWGVARPSWAIIGFLIAWTLSSVAAGVNLPAYFAMLAKCIPPEARGGLFGWGGALSGIVGVAAAEYAGVVLARLAFPGNFAVLFTAAAVILTASVVPLLWTREPPDQIAGEHRSVRQYLADAVRSAGGDREYAWAVAAIAALSFALAAASFYSTYAVRELGAGTRDVARFTAITLGSSVVGMPLLGRIADRRGHKLSLEITATCFAVAAVLALSAGSVESVCRDFAVRDRHERRLSKPEPVAVGVRPDARGCPHVHSLLMAGPRAVPNRSADRGRAGFGPRELPGDVLDRTRRRGDLSCGAGNCRPGAQAQVAWHKQHHGQHHSQRQRHRQ